MVRSARRAFGALALILAAASVPGAGLAQETAPPATVVIEQPARPAVRPKPRPVRPAPDVPAAEAPEALPPAPEAQATAAPPGPVRGPVTNLPLPRFVSLKGNVGNARRGPGLTHRIDWVFTHSGMPLRITAEHDNWRRVEDAEGMGGWVHYALLSGVRTVLVTADMAEFRARPDPAADVVFQAEAGVIGRIVECLPDWCRISIEGTRGWAPKDLLWGADPGEIVE